MPSKYMDSGFELLESKKYGAVLRVDDVEVANEFEDFLTEKHYVFFDVGFEDNNSELFYFGQAACVEKIDGLLEEFLIGRFR